MNLAFFFDSETTGLPLFSKPSEHPDQPHLVQLAGALVDIDARRMVSSFDVMIRPQGWTIPPDGVAIHGITTEMAADLGVPETQAVALLLDLWRERVRVAHNETFDARILRIALKRYAAHFGEHLADTWKAGKAHCTARLATPILKLPPTPKMRAAGRHHHKTANLAEAYEFFTDQPLENAHSAMADVIGCMAVYFGVLDHQAKEAA